MYQELVRRNVIIIALSLLVFFFLSLYTTNFVNQKNVTTELVYLSRILANEIDNTVSESEVSDVVNKFTENQTWFQISVANSHGYILIDSTSDGIGEGVYSSLTEDELKRAGYIDQTDRTYISQGKIYYIEQLNEDIIMRTSIAIVDNTDFIFQSVFFLGVVLIAVLIVSISFTGKTIRTITNAFDEITNNMRTISQGEYHEMKTDHRYEEVRRAFCEVNAVNNSVYQYIQSISSERDKINFIINNIYEGIVILGISGTVYSANKYACEALNIQPQTGSNIRDIINDPFFISKLQQTIDGEGEVRFDFYNKRTDKIYLVGMNRFTQIYEVDSEDLIAVVLTDVTVSRREERIKADFVSNVSHELKTPITSISGFSELLLSGLVKNPDDVQQYISNIHKESVHMKNTIEELLYLSKLEYNNNSVPSDEQVDLAELANAVLDNWQRKAAKHHVKLLDVAGHCTVKGSSALLEHMLSNLVENAIKYNKENGTVLIETGYKEGKPFISVSDTGMGIEARHLDNLFDRFYRVDTSRSRETGGTGLGLTIVQKICQLHNAEINVTSVFGQGSTFTITFGGTNA